MEYIKAEGVEVVKVRRGGLFARLYIGNLPSRVKTATLRGLLMEARCRRIVDITIIRKERSEALAVVTLPFRFIQKAIDTLEGRLVEERQVRVGRRPPRGWAVFGEEIVSPREVEVVRLGGEFAKQWMKRAGSAKLQEVLQQRPRIPRQMDLALLATTEARLGSLREEPGLRGALRESFWRALVDDDAPPAERDAR